MLAKLAFRNIRRSVKDYGVYFVTLVFGVAVFYAFNSVSSQSILFDLEDTASASVFSLTGQFLGMFSVLIACVLGFLVLYANGFLIRRRKQEFGTYLMLGMNPRSVSAIVLMETAVVGLVSLVVGLALGFALSQGMSFVTARGWDDLSSIIKLYEEEGLPVDDLLIGQYVQNPEVAKHFSVYYELFSKYRSDYRIDDIVDGKADESIFERAREAAFDERVSLMGLIVDALIARVREAACEERAASFVHDQLASLRDELETAGVVDAAEKAGECAAAIRAKLAAEKEAGLLTDEKRLSYERAATLLEDAVRAAGGEALTFDDLKERFGSLLDALDILIDAAAAALDAVFRFVEDAFGDGQEMLLLITDLSVNRHSMAFINDHGCDRYFAHNEKLLFHERGGDLAERIGRLNLDEE